MPDITPEEAGLFKWIEDRARETFRLFEFSEIRTPFLEETEVFVRSIGQDTDIVEKEMYAFTDRGGKNVALRPEGTASVIRAYIEHNWSANQDITKLFYIGPMFRGERPQKGRLRQFHQIGAEIIGASNYHLDAEMIFNLHSVLTNMGIVGFEIQLNSLGCDNDRVNYKKALFDFLKERESGLCENCRRRMHTNVLRVLDCKVDTCKSVISGAPRITDHLCADCEKDYASLKKLLKDSGINFSEKTTLVRGLDYYTKTIFEVVHSALGSQDAIAAGGRYDRLCEEMGGPKVGAIGYAMGLERLIMAVNKDNVPMHKPEVLIVAVDDMSRDHAFAVTNYLRKREIACDMDFSGRSVKGGMRKANREGRKWVVIIGENEIKNGKIVLKDMTSGTQDELDTDSAVKKILGEN